MITYFVLMLAVQGGNSAPLMVFTFESSCELARVAQPKQTFCQKVRGEAASK